jgi:broad specificity phosphatase PhoE
MREIELRRHSHRHGGQANLSPAGVALARRIGDGTGPFARVVSSPAERAQQTALAMGFALDRVEFALALPHAGQLALELDMIKTFADAAMLLERSPPVADYARMLRTIAVEIGDELDDGQAALLISHGGVLETLLAACVDDAAHVRTLGPGFSFCEGARLSISADRRFTLIALLRV